MIRIRLKAEEREELERTFRGTPDRRRRDRRQAVLMADRARRRRQIAVHRASAHRWLRAYRAGGLAGLTIRWAAGPPPPPRPRIPEERAATIPAWVKDGPPGCGLERANWTDAELATRLCRVHGIAVRATAMREFCHRHGVRPYRPTYR
jgi:transposase